MNDAFIPYSLRQAGEQLRNSIGLPLDTMPKAQFVRIWCSIAYLFPGLHPDGFEDKDSGWPEALKRYAEEAWRRAELGELEDDELYPCNPQWAGIYDRLKIVMPDERERRLELSTFNN